MPGKRITRTNKQAKARKENHSCFTIEVLTFLYNKEDQIFCTKICFDNFHQIWGLRLFIIVGKKDYLMSMKTVSILCLS